MKRNYDNSKDSQFIGARRKGYTAFQNGLLKKDCPHPIGDPDRPVWIDGWNIANNAEPGLDEPKTGKHTDHTETIANIPHENPMSEIPSMEKLSEVTQPKKRDYVKKPNA